MLNHAAALLFSPDRLARTGRLVAVLLLLFPLVGVGTATALDGIDLSEPLPPPAEGECPLLIQIKYPFLSCPNGQIGQSDRDETWENSRRLPMQGDWNEGDAYWGPTLNVN